MIVKTSLKTLSQVATIHTVTWHETRKAGVKIRQALTNEWAIRGVEKQDQFRQLSTKLSLYTFGISHSQMKALKGLKPGQNLRDHMTEFELILIQLAECSTLEMTRLYNVHGFNHHLVMVAHGGEVAAVARRVFEKNMRMKPWSLEPKKLT